MACLTKHTQQRSTIDHNTALHIGNFTTQMQTRTIH